MEQQLKEQIKNTIHNLFTQNKGIYSSLCFCDSEIIQDYTFNFNMSFDEENLNVEEDMNFFLDNVISKIIEINYNIDYKLTSRLGGNIIYNDVTTFNHYLINDYTFLESTNINSFEDFLNDINVKIDKSINRYNISLTLPIYKLNKENIIVS